MQQQAKRVDKNPRSAYPYGSNASMGCVCRRRFRVIRRRQIVDIMFSFQEEPDSYRLEGQFIQTLLHRRVKRDDINVSDRESGLPGELPFNDRKLYLVVVHHGLNHTY